MDRKPRKGIYLKEDKRPIYKCTHFKRIGHLEPFFNKQKISKGNNLRYYGTNAPRPKKIWAPNVQPYYFACMLCSSGI